MRRTVAPALMLTLAVTSASCKEGWTDEHRQMYEQACMESSNAGILPAAKRRAYCACALEKTVQHYGNIEEVIINKDSTQMRAELSACMAQ